MTFPDLLTAIGYKPRPYAHRAFARCWSVTARGLTLGIVAAAVLDYEVDNRLDPDARAMMIRALRGAGFDALGLDVVIYFPSERIQEST